jgi:hypothetical protein
MPTLASKAMLRDSYDGALTLPAFEYIETLKNDAIELIMVIITRFLAVSALRRATAEVKQLWSVFGLVTKNLLSRTPPCFGRHNKPLVPAAFPVVRTLEPALGPRGGMWPVLMCNP